MPGAIATLPRLRFTGATGAPLAGGLLTTYLTGTTTKTPTWQDQAMTIANTNPIVLDGNGTCVVWLNSALTYKIVLTDQNGVSQWTQSNIVGGGVDASFELSLASLTAALATAQASATAAADARMAIDNRIYPGTYAVAPTTRPDGTAIQDGNEYSGTDGFRYARIAGVWVNQTAAAAGSASTASAKAGISTAQAVLADAARVLAQAARDAANTSGKVFTQAEGTAAGLAATTSGQNFALISTDLLSYQIYRNNAGAALLIDGAAQYTKAYIDLVAPQSPASSLGIKPFIQDTDGRILLGEYMNGDPFPAVADLTAAARLALIEAQLPATPFSPDGIMPFVQDGDNRILSGMYLDGSPFPVPASAFETILPSDDRLLVSDFQTISERSSSRLRFVRSITDSNNYQHCSPGSRVTFDTTATDLKLTFFYNNLVTRLFDRNFIGCVLVAGVVVKTFTSTLGDTGACTVEVSVSLGASALRTVTILWPYGDGMDLVNIRHRGGTITAPAARPAAKLALAGDSITHGFLGSDISNTWAYKVAVLKSRQLVNLGYGSRTAVAADGLALSGTGAGAVCYLIGYNNFIAQTSLATFQTAVQGWLTNARASLPSAKIYAITPIYSPNTNTITLADYRTSITAAVTAVGDGNTVLVNGLTLMTNSNDRLSDNIHPNDLGSGEIATALAAIIT